MACVSFLLPPGCPWDFCGYQDLLKLCAGCRQDLAAFRSCVISRITLRATDRSLCFRSSFYLDLGLAFSCSSSCVSTCSVLSRSQAILALGALKQIQTIEKMRQDENPDVKWPAVLSCRVAVATRSALLVVAEALADENGLLRQVAARALQNLGDFAIPALQDTHEFVEAVANALLQDTDEFVRDTVVEAMVEVLHSEDSTLRRYARRILCKSGPSAKGVSPQLVLMLASDRANVRHSVVDIMFTMGTCAAPATVALAKLHFDDDNFEYKHKAGQVLSNIGQAAAPFIPDLIEMLQSPYFDTKRTALNALFCLGKAAVPAIPVLVCLLGEPYFEFRDGSNFCLLSFWSDFQSDVFDLLHSLGTAVDVASQQLVCMLKHLGFNGICNLTKWHPNAEQFQDCMCDDCCLHRALEDIAESAANYACDLLESFAKESDFLVSKLLALLQTSSTQAQLRSLRVLNALKDSVVDAVPDIVRCMLRNRKLGSDGNSCKRLREYDFLCSHYESEIDRKAARGCAKQTVETKLHIAIDHHGDQFDAFLAADMIIDCGSRACPGLTRLFYDRSPELRLLALQLLVMLKQHAAPASRAIARLLADSSDEVRELAKEALVELGHKAGRAAPVLKELIEHDDRKVRQLASHVFIFLGKSDVALEHAMTKLLHDKCKEVRKNAAEVIGTISEGRKVGVATVSALQAMNFDRDQEMRHTAQYWLLQMGEYFVDSDDSHSESGNSEMGQ